MLISTVLDYGTKRFAPGHDLPYVLHLPTFAATAWYQKKLPIQQQGRTLREFLDEVEEFALGDYMTALARTVFSGCSSAAKQHYLRHLEATISPSSPDQEPIIVAVPKSPRH